MITFSRIGKMGRFGNQMFQYATLYSVAKENSFEFGVPYSNISQNEHFHFCLPEIFPNLSATNCSDSLSKQEYKEKSFDYDSDIFSIKDDTDISGYFQSEKYFAKHRKELLKEFEFDSELKENVIKLKNNIGPCISLHLRLTDYISSNGKYPICTIEYYEQALQKMPGDIPVVLFSDDKNLAIKYLSKLNRKYIVLNNNDKFVEMCLMSACDYHIIANSTFSWWGAWLSNSKLVVIPKIWFGNDGNPETPKLWNDIYPEGWIIA